MKTSKLIVLGIFLNGVIDSGKQITLSTVEDAISDGTIINFLNTELPEIDLSYFDKGELSELVDNWQSLLNCVDSQRKFLVSNSGLCLLISYCFQLVAENNIDKN